MHNAKAHPFNTAGLTTRFFLTGAPDISPAPRPRNRRTRVDPLAALTWLILMPLATTAGWYGVFRLARLLWDLL